MKNFTLLLVFSLLFGFYSYSQVLHVPSAFTTIQSAIDAASDNDTILIDNSVFLENIIITKPLTLTSNYLYTQDTLDINQTIIDGDENGPVIKILNVATSKVEVIGLSITGGNGTLADPDNLGYEFLYGGGIFIENTESVELSHLKITENILTTDNNSAGGVYAYNTNISILACNISDNMVVGGSLLGEGAGVFIYNSEADINLCNISNNTGGQPYGKGGGIYAKNSFLSVSNSLISDNSSIHTGGIYGYNLTGLELENVSVKDNIAEFSAGVYNYNSDIIPCNIIDCDFISNIANNSGGAVSLYKVDAVLSNVSVNDNEGGLSNGGISFSYSNIQMNHSEIRRNTSSSGIGGDAAGILSNNSNLQFFDVIIDSNECLNSSHFNEGGGININYGSLSMDSVTITNNIAGQGAAIGNNSTSIEIRNCLIANNTANYEGGIIYSYNTDYSIINSTLPDNHAGNAAIYSIGSSFLLLNSILWNPTETEVYFDTDFNDESYLDLAYSDIRGTDEYIITNNYGDVSWHDGNINEDPLFTDPETFDYSLQESSLLIDAGTVYFELDGQVVIDYDESQYEGTSPDMGAYEFVQVTFVQEALNSSINVYPNPFHDQLIIEMPKEFEKEVTLQLFNSCGKLIHTQKINPNTSPNIFLKTDNLQEGFYFLKLNDGLSIQSKKIIKI